MKEYIKKSKKIIFELIVCIVLRTILLINPILYSKTINYVSDSRYSEALNILMLYVISMSIYNYLNTLDKEHIIQFMENYIKNQQR